MKVRRIHTGFQGDGSATIVSDGPAQNVVERSEFGTQSAVIWAFDQVPAVPSSDEDPAIGFDSFGPPKGGGVLRVVEFSPLAATETAPDVLPATIARLMHTTPTLDFGIVISGEIRMYIDTEQFVTLKAGDTVVQTATPHAWLVTSEKPCRLAFFILDAQSPND